MKPRIQLPSSFPFFDLVLFLYAFTLRLLFWTAFEDRKFLYSLFYYGDSFRLHNEALDILSSNWESTLLPYHPPVTSYLLAAFYQIFGNPPEHLTALKIFLILMSATSVVIFHRLARRYLPEKLALLSAIIFAAAFPMLVTAVVPNTESIFLCFAMLSFLFFARLRDSLKTGDAIGMGVCGALASLTRAEFASYFIVLAAGFVVSAFVAPHSQNPKTAGRAQGSPLHRSKHTSLVIPLTLAFILPFVPWTIRNYSVLKEFNTKQSDVNLEPLPTFAAITCYGPINFAMANNLLADGKFSRSILVGANEASLQLNNAQHRHYFLHGYSEGFKFIRDYPKEFLKLAAKKIELFASGFSWGFAPTNLPVGLKGVRYPVDIFISDNRWWEWVMMPIFLLGFFLSLGKFSQWWPFHLLFLHRLAVTTAFFGYVRGLAAIYFVVILFLFYPFSLNLKRMDWLDRIPKQTLLIVAILFFTTLSLIPHMSPVRFQASGPSEGGTGYLIQDEEIHIWPKK